MIYEHEPLWIIIMVVMSAISTLVAVFVRKRVRASAHTTGGAPSLPLPRLGVGEEEEEMVQIERTNCGKRRRRHVAS